MAPQLMPFLMDELERGRFLDLVRASRNGHLPSAAWVMDLLRKVLFACGVEYLAALAPLTRLGEGKFSLAGAPEARCWPADAAASADIRRCPGSTVTVEGRTGAWEDGNARQQAVAWGEAVAGRIWRRPDDPCSPLEAAERLFALAGLAILAERAAARGYPTGGDAALPHVPDAPPLVPHLPGDTTPPPPAAAGASAAYADAEVGPLVAVPVLVLDALVSIAAGMQELAVNPACFDAFHAGGATPEEVGRAAELACRLGERALGGEWSAEALAAADASRRAEVVNLARVRRARGTHLRPIPPTA